MAPLRTKDRAPTRAIVAALCAMLGQACGAPPPRMANPSRPLDERRAVEIIIETFRQQQDTPVRGSDVPLAQGKALQVDVGAQGKKYGVAFLTGGERAALGEALPPRDPAMGDALQLVSGAGAHSDVRVLVLHDADYQYDDPREPAQPKSTIAAELKLRRDVRDFLVRAHSANWP